MRVSRATSKHSLPAREGFTLIEVLVSMAVLSVIVLMMSNLLNSALQSLSNGESDQERHRSGRALTDFIGRELRAALLPTEIEAASGQANLQLVINPTQILASTDNLGGSGYLNADTIFWQAPLATDATYGDIAEVGYFVKWISHGSTFTPTLCRFFVNPSTLNSSGSVTQNPNFLIYTLDSVSGKPKDWVTPALLDAVAPADNVNNHGYVGLFAENVLGLWVQSYGINNVELSPANGATRGTYDSRVGYSLQTGQSGGLAETRYLPALIKISIAQIDSKYAARLSPAVSQIRALVTASVNATNFYQQTQSAASSSGAVRGLLPGIRIYSTDVFLDNAR